MILLAAVVLSGCSVSVPGNPVREPRADPRAALPFQPAFPDRTNERNDGSSFEPCTAFTADELLVLGVDPASRRDAAISSGPNYRGCAWKMRASHVRQIVADQGSLDSYVAAHDEIEWREREHIGDRTFAVGGMYERECLAVFKSQGAVVITLASLWHADRWPQSACEWVVDFASLAASKAP